MNCLKNIESSLALKCFSKVSLFCQTRKYIHLSASRFEKDSRNHYEVLKVGKNSTTKEIRDAFIKLSKENHPDKNQTDPDNHKKFVRINEAYSVLSQAKSRSEYDMSLPSRYPGGPSMQGSSYSEGGPFGAGSGRQSDFYKVYRDQTGRTHYYYAGRDFNLEEALRKARARSDNQGPFYGVPGVKKRTNGEFLALLVFISLIAGLMQIFLVRVANLAIRDNFQRKTDEHNRTLTELQLNARKHGNKQVLNQMFPKDEQVVEDLELKTE